MIPRYTPIRRKRATPRSTDIPKAEKEACRLMAYDRARGICEIRGDQECQSGVPAMFRLPFDGPLRVRGHLVHLRNKRMWGWGAENVCWGCAHCHLDLVHWGRIKLPKTYSELVGEHSMGRRG
jgi:hypothetical protein